jgi:hypothetical protein
VKAVREVKPQRSDYHDDQEEQLEVHARILAFRLGKVERAEGEFPDNS